MCVHRSPQRLEVFNFPLPRQRCGLRKGLPPSSYLVAFDRREDEPMPKLMQNFWHDERGYVLATEWMLVASLLTLGIIATLLVES